MLQQVREPFFHSSSAGQLFGVCHHPCSKNTVQVAVIICAPIGAEYFGYHRIMVLLADMFAKRGIPCVRFDYSGCGDSGGAEAIGSIEQWLSDIGCMVTLLRDEIDPERICLCGIRFGASLAATYGAERESTEKLILWDPVVDGRQYVAELSRNHKRWLGGTFAKARKVDRACQRLGFPCSGGLRRDLQGMNLFRSSSAPAKDILILRSEAPKETEKLSQHLNELTSIVEVHEFSKEALPLKVMRVAAEWAEK